MKIPMFPGLITIKMVDFPASYLLVLGRVVSPLRIGLWDPFQMAVLWLVNGGDPNYLLSGMILQELGNPKDSVWEDWGSP